jgi:hypothetical protein
MRGRHGRSGVRAFASLSTASTSSSTAFRDETVQVLRVVHGARDLDALFADEPLPK